MAYTDAEIATALVGPNREWAFRYDIYSGASIVTSSVDVQSCTVKCAYLVQGPNRTCDVALGPDVVFDQLSHSLRVIARLKMLDGGFNEWVLGTFRLSSSSRRQATTAGDRPQSMTGYDYILDFQEAKVLDRYVVASGTVVTTAVRTAIAAVGTYTTNIVSSTKTLPAAMEWEPGTSYLDIINSLLTSINYDSLSVDVYGNPYSNPYVAPEASTIRWYYRVDATSVIKPGVDTDLDLFNVPNVWLAFVSEPDRPALRAVAINDDAGSKTSTLARGRQIVQIVDTGTLTSQQQSGVGSAQAGSQADLDALVLRAKSESSTIYEQVKFNSGLMPFHGVGDAIVVNYGSGDGTYRETEWSMNLTAGGDMSHDCRRAVTL